MPRFEPFAGVRFDESIDLNAVTAPPYDVIDGDERAALAGRTAYNMVHVDVPVEEEGPDRYTLAAGRLDAWRSEGVLVTDAEPSLYVYRMGFHDEQGRPRQTTGVIGALGLEPPGEGDVLPHERTTPKAKSDRLELLRATRANLSPIWGLSMAEGLTALCEPAGPPVGRCTDEHGVHHRLWRLTSTAVVDAVTAAVASAPVVVADGHHRYETCLAYREERRSAGEDAGPWDLTMALVVELTEDQLDVRAIHRLLSDLPEGTDVMEALEPWFVPFETTTGGTLPARMDDACALGLLLPGGRTWLLRPRPEAFPDDLPDLDSSRLDVAREALGPQQVVYQHGLDAVIRQVDDGTAQAGVLLRPATVAQIAATARRRDRMPPKTTFFSPKPRTGMVLRDLG